MHLNPLTFHSNSLFYQHLHSVHPENQHIVAGMLGMTMLYGVLQAPAVPGAGKDLGHLRMHVAHFWHARMRYLSCL